MKKVISIVGMMLVLLGVVAWTGSPPPAGQVGQPVTYTLNGECKGTGVLVSSYHPATLTLKLWRNGGILQQKVVQIIKPKFIESLTFTPYEKGYWVVSGDVIATQRVRQCTSIFKCRWVSKQVSCFRNSLTGYVGLCGDGVIDDNEQCDDINLINGDGCSNKCTIEVCGNYVVDAGEQCDSPSNVKGCNNDCTINYCGDGIIDSPWEFCDDGNTVNGDGCDCY